VGFACAAYIYLSLPDVRPLRTTNPTSTAFMRLRERDAHAQGKPVVHDQRWVPYARIAASLKKAVIVTEDDAYWQHDGVDYDQLRDAVETNLERGEFARGASTITQQLAKNLYLNPDKNPLRKVKELLITRRLEVELSKQRILEIYLNVIEWGDQVWGAEAAARTYFRTSASALSRDQAALLAGAIINPRVYSPAHPPARLLGRQRIILARMGGVEPPAPVHLPTALSESDASEIPTSLDVPQAPSTGPPDGDEPAQPPPPQTSTPETDQPR
jgi:monofunctional biosynthetic peptidoglycan transglycosylase